MTAPSEPGAPRPRVRRVPTALLVLAGVLGGGAVGWGLFALTDRGATDGTDRIVLERPGSTADDPARAANDFLEAWTRYRSATYTATLEFERVAATGQSLRSSSTYAQKPPRRIVRQSDSVLLTAGDASVTCNTVGGATTCAPAPALDYQGEITKEIAIWKTAVLAAVPYYRVSEPDDGCFQLDLLVTMPDPPYGTVARFCFDAATGALLKRQIVRDGATDTEEATSVSATVPDDAFVVPTTTTGR